MTARRWQGERGAQSIPTQAGCYCYSEITDNFWKCSLPTIRDYSFKCLSSLRNAVGLNTLWWTLNTWGHVTCRTYCNHMLSSLCRSCNATGTDSRTLCWWVKSLLARLLEPSALSQLIRLYSYHSDFWRSPEHPHVPLHWLTMFIA